MKRLYLFLPLLFALVTGLSGCGGSSGAPTAPLMPDGISDGDNAGNYNGPVPATAAVQAFKLALWDRVVEANRCSACHGVGGQSPTFARNDDINAAYNDALAVVDLATPSRSTLVTKVGGGHNCWLGDNAACAEIMTRWITEWSSSSGGVAARVVELVAPTLRDVGASKVLPEDPGAFASTVHPLLTAHCASCHSENGRPAQSPLFASASVEAAYAAVRSKIDLNTPANSRLVLRLRNEFHHCWSDCESDASTLEQAITRLAEGVATSAVDPALVVSKALFLEEDGIVANAGGRHESDIIALFEFKTGEGSIAYDTSGVSPALNLTLYGDVDWVGGWGVRFNGGNARAQGTVAGSRKLAEHIKAAGEYSIEAWVAPGNVTQDDSARIVSYSGSASQRNFTLGQSLFDYDFLQRSATTDVNGEPALSTPEEAEILQATQQHVVLTYDPQNGRRIYVNGALVSGTDTVAPGLLNDWDESFALVLGNETSGDRPWQGVIRLLAIHDRALSPAQITQNFSAGVGQKYLMLFNVSAHVGVADAYVVFEVSQFDDYSYLFAEPYFISLQTGVTLPTIPLKGMRIGINGKEAGIGQAFSRLDTVIDSNNYLTSGTPLSALGTVIALERGPQSDEFFLSFERLGNASHVVVEADGTAPVAVDLPAAASIGLRTFDEVNATMARLTTVSPQHADVAPTFATLRQQLPGTENIQTFLASQQVAIAQLSIAYCDALVEDTALRNAWFPGVDFNAAASVALSSANRSRVVTPLLQRLLSASPQALQSQPDTQEMQLELDGLIDTLLQCGGSCAPDRTRTVVKAACAAVLGSATTLIQ